LPSQLIFLFRKCVTGLGF